MESKIAELEPKDKEIEGLKADLESITSAKDKEIGTLKRDLEQKVSVKDTEIASLKNDLEVKVNQINELNDKIISFEAQISDSEGAPNVIEQIKAIMKNKGFLSDREFDDLLKQ